MRERQKQDDKNSCSKWYHSSQSFRAPGIKTHTAWKKLGRKKKPPHLRFCRKPKNLNPKSQRSHSLSLEDPPRDQSIYLSILLSSKIKPEKKKKKKTHKQGDSSKHESIHRRLNKWSSHKHTHTHKQKNKFLSHPQKAPSIRILPKAQSPRTKQKVARKKQNTSQVSKWNPTTKIYRN